MAVAAEARAVWQRTANRYFAEAVIVSGCRPSSSKQPETIPVNNNERLMFFDFSSDSRWWLFSNSHQFVENQDYCSSSNSVSKESFEFVDINMDMKFQHSGKLPWWQMTGKNDLGPREKRVGESESSKGKILEALRHSQTRARKAEKAAKEAYAEKEDVVKVVLRQASELFACRRWIHLLQLENLYYQIKIDNKKMNPMLSGSPQRGVVCKNGKLQKKMKKKVGRRGSRGYEDNLWNNYAVVFAMGLGVVGAGLLLGWTVGWMFI